MSGGAGAPVSESPLVDELRALELRLLDPELRRSPDALEELIDEDFTEFGASGRQFDRDAIVEALGSESPRECTVTDFRVTSLAPDVALVTYRVESAGTSDSRASLRSSVWKRRDGRFRLHFHQGTACERKRSEGPKLYRELSPWWPVMSAPSDYAEEALFFGNLLEDACRRKPTTVLELGSGGGNNASHLASRFEMTLVDRAPGMIDVSRKLNPNCEHVVADMRDVRLGRMFDAVFVHDAICYMTTLEDLRRVMETAFVHCAPGGAAVFAPDDTRENFRPETDCGGHDGDDRALRYLEWSWDFDPNDTTTTVDYAYLLRDGSGQVRVEHDRHTLGVFGRDDWLRLLREVGFDATGVLFDHSEVEAGSLEVFIGRRPQEGETA